MRERFRKLWPLIKALLGLVIVVVIGRSFYIDLRENPAIWQQSLRPGWLVLSGALYLLGLSFSALCWHRLLRTLGQRPSFPAALRAYYIGHMGKYLPGKAWALFLRAALVRGPGVTLGLATVTAFYEVLVTMSAGVLMSAVLFGLLLPHSGNQFGSGRGREQSRALLQEITRRDNRPIDWQRLRREVTLSEDADAPIDRTFGMGWALGLLVPLLIPILPPVFNRLVHRLSLPFRSKDTVLPKFGTRGLIEGLLATGIGWMCLGGSLWAVLQGTLPRPPAWGGDTWGLLTAIVGVSYVAGFVILLAPSGLGVREFFLTLFLVALLGCTSPEAEASVLLAVLVLRLVWTAAEVVMIALVWRLPGPAVFGRREEAL